MLKHKRLHFVLLFIFVTSLHAGATSADTICMAKCCLETNPIGMFHTVGEQMRSLPDCHSGVPSIPCDLQSGKTVTMPECTLTTSCNSSPNTLGTIKILSILGFDKFAVQPDFLDQTVAEKCHPPPIYLQVQSFII